MKFIESLFDSKEITDYLLHNIALSLNGKITNRKFFNIFTGNSNNGKSLLFTFLLRVFGKYGYSLSSDLFTCLSKDPNSANVLLYGLIGVRLAIISELEDNAVIYTKLIKSITTCLQKLKKEYTEKTGNNIIEKDIKLKFIGELDKLPTKLQKLIKLSEKKTGKKKLLQVNIALNYGSRIELINAIKEINKKKIKVNENNINKNYI